MADPYGATAEQASGPASLQIGVVRRVNMRQYTVDVETTFSQKLLLDVPFATPYSSKSHNGGIYFMPEEGSECVVAVASENVMYVIGWVQSPSVNPLSELVDGVPTEEPTGEAPNFRGNRDALEPGDIYLGTADGNRIILRKGGMVEVGSTGMAQRIYFPVENMVRDVFQRYEALSPIGNVSWGYATISSDGLQIDEGTAERTPALIGFNVKGFAQDVEFVRKYAVELRLGNLGASTLDPELLGRHMFADEATSAGKSTDLNRHADGVVSFVVHDMGSSTDPASRDAVIAAPVSFAFQLSRTGNTFVFTSGHIHVETAKKVYLKCPSILVESPGVFSIDVTDLGKLLASFKEEILVETLKSLKMFVAGDIDLAGGANVLLGKNANEGVVRGNPLLKFLTDPGATGFKVMTAFGPSGPMIGTFPAGVVSTTIRAKE